MTDYEAMVTVLSHPNFHGIERVHLAHVGECPDEPVTRSEGTPCWRFDVAVGLREGRVEWFCGGTWEEALRLAAAAIAGGAR
jgi:hypothetical protein